MQALLESAVKAVRHVSGHDRVMAYRFLENGDGEVAAECKGPGIEPYLGLRYPAWDIPTQVRQIMLRAPFRVIGDTRADHTGLIQASDAPPLDMTLSQLRGVSPIHVEYLENMGVRATMNVSLIVRGKLWGLIAFHHYRPRSLTPDQRSICELFGQLASMMIQQEEERTRLGMIQRTQSLIAAMDTRGSDLSAVFDRFSRDFMDAVGADGIGIVCQGSMKFDGDVPSDDVVQALCEQTTDGLVLIDSLASLPNLASAQELGTSAGALMLRLPGDDWLLFFRNEVIHEIRWAGEKKKNVTVGPHGTRLTPRESFAEYTESVAGRCHPWSSRDVDTASEICRELWKIMQISGGKESQQLAKQKRYQDLLIAELNHRVRNTLALVRSIARQATASSGSVEQYVEMLEKRIAALSKAHDLIGGSGLQWASIVDLVAAELHPFKSGDKNVLIEGPSTSVRADVAPLIALLFHEMTANSVKHGALSDRGGTLAIRWHEESGGVAINWQEDLPVEIEKPESHGFGFALIERAIPYECNGKASIEINGKQLKISFWLPTEAIDHLADRNESIEEAAKESSGSCPMDLSSLGSALVLEDNLVLAMELERMLLELGIKRVDTSPSVDHATRAIREVNYDCAVMDINLGEQTSFDVAIELVAAGTPVVLASGYDSKYELPKSLTRIPRLVKPICRPDLVNAISDACRDQTK